MTNRAILACLAMAAILAGCGGDRDAGESTGSAFGGRVD